MRSLTAASRSALRAWTMTSGPSLSRVCAAARPSPPAEPVMKMRAMCFLSPQLSRRGTVRLVARFGAGGIVSGEVPARVELSLRPVVTGLAAARPATRDQ